MADAAKKKRKREKNNKVGLYLAVGLVIILVEVGLSYFVVSRMHGSDPAVFIDTVPSDSAAAAQKAVRPESVKKEKGSQGKAGDTEPFQLAGNYTLADFVINPAYSNGKHFFVSTIVFGVDKKSLEERLTQLEPILKDRIISQLSLKPFEWYVDNKNRPLLKEELKEIALNLLNEDSGVEIFFTKYVLQ